MGEAVLSRIPGARGRVLGCISPMGRVPRRWGQGEALPWERLTCPIARVHRHHGRDSSLPCPGCVGCVEGTRVTTGDAHLSTTMDAPLHLRTQGPSGGEQ